MTLTKQILKPLALLLAVTWSSFLFATPVIWHLSFIDTDVNRQGYDEVAGIGHFSYDLSKCTNNKCKINSISINFMGSKYKPEKKSDLVWNRAPNNTEGPRVVPTNQAWPDEKWVLKQDKPNTFGELVLQTDSFSPSSAPSWLGEWKHTDKNGKNRWGSIIGIRVPNYPLRLPLNFPVIDRGVGVGTTVIPVFNR